MAAFTTNSRQALGVATILFAIFFNVPFAILAASFDYPDILRRSPGEVLDRFAEGGAALVLTWHAFAVAALLLVPLASAMALTPSRIAATPIRAIGAAIAGALAGLLQAMGLWRWVFVVPDLAHIHAEPATPADAVIAAERAFAVLNAYGGVAIGEHMGQLMAALFATFLAGLQWSEGLRRTAAIGLAAAAFIAFGTTEGLAIALGRSGELFATATVVGFLVLTLWLILTGASELRSGRRAGRLNKHDSSS
ncbi:DUF4386 family protein [Phaeovulum sp.]|uniref:DUF4386 family protein n=1 Tax=Phaeovulum sp. TaxID=2934796 RepID=UPI00273201A2|nr:DUF4386 family protein [Phaeovulum sp.]MDP1668693.1 DUF4386 family protein [Phaeovulum sp.]MDZ4120407.1 DUF4386 family protein [Phaeovulum sp.]